MSGYGFPSAGTTYDHENRLSGFARASGSFTQSWNLTSVGDWNSVTTNGTVQNRTHGPTQELPTAGGQNVSTDVKGNITYLSLPLPLGEGRGEGGIGPHPVSLLWDFDNKLKSADVDNNGTTDVNFHYDALGRRVARLWGATSTDNRFVECNGDCQEKCVISENGGRGIRKHIVASGAWVGSAGVVSLPLDADFDESASLTVTDPVTINCIKIEKSDLPMLQYQIGRYNDRTEFLEDYFCVPNQPEQVPGSL